MAEWKVIWNSGVEESQKFKFRGCGIYKIQNLGVVVCDEIPVGLLNYAVKYDTGRSRRKLRFLYKLCQIVLCLYSKPDEFYRLPHSRTNNSDDKNSHT